jgi:hypothetical protein
MSHESIFDNFSPDLWCEIFYRCSDLKDVVRLWIAFGLRRTITKTSKIWTYVLEHFLTRIGRRGGGCGIFEAAERMQRPCLTINLTGLDLLAQLHKLRKCSRSGCLRNFIELENHKSACTYHTGKIRAGYLSCCRAKSFRAPGCKEGYHDGDFFDYAFSKRPHVDDQISSADSGKPTENQSLKLPSIHIHSPCASGNQEHSQSAKIAVSNEGAINHLDIYDSITITSPAAGDRVTISLPPLSTR